MTEEENSDQLLASYNIVAHDDAIEYRKVMINEASAVHCSNALRSTKYTPVSFLPKNLYEQFKRLANCYFLMICLVQLIPGVTPIPPITSIAPLVFVLSVTALKEGFEDYLRGKEDRKINARETIVVSSGRALKTAYQDIKVGHVLMLQDGDEVPADMVLLSSSDESGACFVETSNLDGETNLKAKACPTTNPAVRSPEEASALAGELLCEPPNEELYNFEGKLTMSARGATSASVPLSAMNLLLRGSRVKNVSFVHGVVIYSGGDTKLVLNQHPPPSKRSNVEKRLNRYLVGIFCSLMTLVVVSAGMSSYYRHQLYPVAAYLQLAKLESTGEVVRFLVFDSLTFLVLFNLFIPMSLYVSLEVAKFWGAMLIMWDKQMYDAEFDHAAVAKTSNLNEELGQVAHVFSDKTGTLTRNEMVFRRLSVNGKVYDGTPHTIPANMEGELSSDESLILGDHMASDADVRACMLALALCHTVFVATKPEDEGSTNHGNGAAAVEEYSDIEYQASSPDEEALVAGARAVGAVFVGRTANEMVVDVLGSIQSFELLHVLEFDSTRKRMSVVLRLADGTVRLVTKGADSSMISILSHPEELDASTERNIERFAELGLRVLMVGSRDIPEEEYVPWAKKYSEVEMQISNREAGLKALALQIESNVHMLGATAVEDKLQEEVPEVISSLLTAGMKVWVLTGDKVETAINIGRSCSLLQPQMREVILKADTFSECRNSLKVAAANVEQDAPEQQRAVIVDGATLSFCLSDALKGDFLALCNSAHSVLCCRTSPLQKARVVLLVKENNKNHLGEGPITLAIGDGANDVSMIQEADVGIGIFGREGRQAAMSSDYAIGKFKFLKRLLLVHGRYSYLRLTMLIQYSFYKNISFTLPQFFFAFYNGFSGQPYIDAYLMTVFNMVFTAAPVMAYALFEKDVSEKMLLDRPELYQAPRNGEWFTARTMTQWLFGALWHAVVVFFSTYVLTGSATVLANGQMLGLWAIGAHACAVCVVVVTGKIFLHTQHFTALNVIAIVASILLYYAFLFPFCLIVGLQPNDMLWVAMNLAQAPATWLALVVVPIGALLPDFCLQWFQLYFRPRPADHARAADLAAAASVLSPLLRSSSTKGYGSLT